MKSKKALPVKEIYLQRAIVEVLNYSGCVVWRTNSGRMAGSYTNKRGITKTRMVTLGIAGTSDIIGYLKGDATFIAIEVKIPGREKYVTDLQKQFLDNVNDAGGIAGVATSVEEAQEIITRFKNSLGEL